MNNQFKVTSILPASQYQEAIEEVVSFNNFIAAENYYVNGKILTYLSNWCHVRYKNENHIPFPLERFSKYVPWHQYNHLQDSYFSKANYLAYHYHNLVWCFDGVFSTHKLSIGGVEESFSETIFKDYLLGLETYIKIKILSAVCDPMAKVEENMKTLIDEGHLFLLDEVVGAIEPIQWLDFNLPSDKLTLLKYLNNTNHYIATYSEF
jgi:hypothetical protein